jgi:hypothetical protein
MRYTKAVQLTLVAAEKISKAIAEMTMMPEYINANKK